MYERLMDELDAESRNLLTTRLRIQKAAKEATAGYPDNQHSISDTMNQQRFEQVYVPNAKTIAAMREARAGNLESFDSVEALMADLNAKG